MATRHGRYFRTRKGIFGRYKYVNGRRVAFVPKRPVRVSRRSYRNRQGRRYVRFNNRRY